MIKERSLEKKPSQISVGNGALEFATLTDKQEDAEPAAIESIERIAHRQLPRDTDLRNIQDIILQPILWAIATNITFSW
jgi:hypothetical protein